MPQGDYQIANDSGANVRTDINNLNLAIVSFNSGATAPSTTFAHMFWADTTPSGYTIFKVRDAGDANWFTLFDDEGRWKGADGTEAEPGISFGSAVGTGAFLIGSNNIGWSLGGVKFLDLSAGNITYESAGPTYILSETGEAADEGKWIWSSTGAVMKLGALNDAETLSSSVMSISRSGGTLTTLTSQATAWRFLDGSAGAPVRSYLSDTDSGEYRIGANNIGWATGGTPAMSIDASQQVGIGTAGSTDSLLHVQDASVNSVPTITLENDAILWQIFADGASFDQLKIGKLGTVFMQFNTSGNMAVLVGDMTVTLGDLIVSAGETFLNLPVIAGSAGSLWNDGGTVKVA